MNPGICLPKYEQNEGVEKIDTRQFHVIGLRIGRNTIEDELAHVGVFPFVSLKRNIEQSDPNNDYEGNCKNDEKEGRDAFWEEAKHDSCVVDGHRMVVY